MATMQSRETWGRLRQTRAVRIVGVYAATAWGVFEIIDKTVRTFGWTEAIPQTSLVLLVVGLFIVGFAAWAYAGEEVGERTGWTWPARIQALLANRWFGRIAVAGLGVAVLLWGWRVVRPDVRYAPFSVPELRATSEAPRVAVLPVTSSAAGLDLPRRTLSRLLATDLNDVDDMRTIRSDLVSRRWEERSVVEPKTVARLGHELGIHFVVAATVERGGEGMRASAEVLEAGRGESIGHVVVEGREGDLPGLSDRLAMEVYRALLEEDDVASLTSPRRARTSSMHAFKSYLRAERAFRRADFDLAIAEYRHAISADSAFAMAFFHEGLARRWADPAVGPPLETFDVAMEHADRLLEDDREMLRASGALEWGMLESVSALAAVVERGRDDPQAWYLLADAEAYVGESLLLTPDSVESTLARAVAADPGFAPTHLFRVPIALLRGAERPEAEALVDAVAAANAHSSVVAEERLLIELAFGDVDRASALDDIPVNRLWRLASALAAPRLAHRQVVVLQEIRRRADRIDPREAKRALFYNFLARGLHADALALLDDPGMVGFWPEAVYRATQRGMSLPANLVLEATNVYDQYAAGATWFYGGAMAADEGRWNDVSFAFDRLIEEARIIGEQGDGLSSREHSIVAGILDQYARVRSDPTRERVVELETRRLAGAGSSEWAWMVDTTARWWLGELWLELGDRDQAARYFRSLWRDPMAVERLRVIEAGGTGASPGRVARR
jgi:tetratricopeptide (TPR) repeat protein